MHEPVTGTHSHEGPGGEAEQEHTHSGDASHEGVYDPDGDGDDDSSAEGDTDHDYVEPDGSPGPKASLRNADKYKQADRDRMSSSGSTMDDGSYPGAPTPRTSITRFTRSAAAAPTTDSIRAHIIKRAAALGLSSRRSRTTGTPTAH